MSQRLRDLIGRIKTLRTTIATLHYLEDWGYRNITLRHYHFVEKWTAKDPKISRYARYFDEWKRRHDL